MRIGVLTVLLGVLNSSWMLVNITAGLSKGLIASMWYINLPASLIIILLLPFVWLGYTKAILVYVALSSLFLLEAALQIVANGIGTPGLVTMALSTVFLCLSVGYMLVEYRRSRRGGVHPLDMPVYG